MINTTSAYPQNDMEKITFEVWFEKNNGGEWESHEHPSPYIGLTAGKLEHSLSGLQQPDDIVINKRSIKVLFDYPFEHPSVVELYPFDNVDYFTRAGLAKAIARQYQNIYREEDETTTLPVETIDERARRTGVGFPGMMNRGTTDGKWGIWGHVLSDLDLTTVYRNGTDYYELSLDS